MTDAANAISNDAEHAVIGLPDFVIFMTHNTARQPHLLKGCGVGTLAEEIPFLAVALTAHRGNGIHAGWPGSVISMTTIAARRSKIVPVQQCSRMDTLAVFIELVCRNLVSRHMVRIGVALCACRCDLGGVNRRLWIADRPDIVDAVAARACGDILVAFRAAHAMHA